MQQGLCERITQITYPQQYNSIQSLLLIPQAAVALSLTSTVLSGVLHYPGNP